MLEDNDIDDLIGGPATRSPEMPAGQFPVILADPPWSFVTYGNKAGQVPQRAKEQHYKVMSLDDLKAMPVTDVTAKNAVLLMWVIDSHLEQSFDLARSWGFTYKTLAFVWDKGRMGLGHWTRKEAEFCFSFAKGDPGSIERFIDDQGELCLLFAKGKPKRRSGGVRQIIRAPRREHSRKPDEQYERIETLLGGPYLELFSRTDRPGWVAWGNEIGKFSPVGQSLNMRVTHVTHAVSDLIG